FHPPGQGRTETALPWGTVLRLGLAIPIGPWPGSDGNRPPLGDRTSAGVGHPVGPWPRVGHNPPPWGDRTSAGVPSTRLGSRRPRWGPSAPARAAMVPPPRISQPQRPLSVRNIAFLIS